MNEAPQYSMKQELASNWDFTHIQLDAYRSMLINYDKFVLALQNTNSPSQIKETHYMFCASLKSYLMTVQYLFYEYIDNLKEDSDYINDLKFLQIQTVYKIYDYQKLNQTAGEIVQLSLILNHWSQKYGCFKTFSNKIKYSSVEEQVDAENG